MKRNFIKFCSTFSLLLFVFILLLVPNSFAANSDLKYKKSLIDKGFPEAYADKLINIHKDFPNWEFTPLFINGTLNEEIDKQGERTWAMTPKYAPRLHTIDGDKVREGKFHLASRLVLANYMDPLNFIGSPRYIHMFEELSFNPQVHTVSAVQKVLNNTFMQSSDGKVHYRNFAGKMDEIPKSYSQIIWEAGKKYNINPIYLASKILVEVGKGGSSSVQGAYGDYSTPNYPKYCGYYNFFNWGATGNDPVGAGLDYAKKENWNNPEASIYGGAKKTSENYISKGQQTSYLQKFNINPNTQTASWHQYMASIYAPLAETGKTFNSYKSLGMLSNKRNFLIPVFKDYGAVNIKTVVFDYTDSAKVNNNVKTAKLRSSVWLGEGDSKYIIKNIPTGSDVSADYGIHVNPNYDYSQLVYFPLWYKINYKGRSGYVFEDAIDKQQQVIVKRGQSLSLKIKKNPSNASEKPMFMVLDSRIASIDKNGVVTGKSYGKTKAVVFSKNGSFDVININVDKNVPKPPNPPNPPKPDNPTGDEFLSSSIYRIDGILIKNISEKTTVKDFKTKIDNGDDVTVKKDGKILEDGDLISTDCDVLYKNKIYKTVIKYDVNGDGRITAIDSSLAAYTAVGARSLSQAKFCAADVNDDGKITAVDASKIAYKVVGLI